MVQATRDGLERILYRELAFPSGEAPLGHGAFGVVSVATLRGSRCWMSVSAWSMNADMLVCSRTESDAFVCYSLLVFATQA